MKFTTISFIAGASIMLITQACNLPQTHTHQAATQKKESSPQYRDGKFNNSNQWRGAMVNNVISTTWKFLFGGEQREPDRALPVASVDLSWFENRNQNQLNATWLGHSSLMINIDGNRILADPVFEKRISIVGPVRFNGEPPLNITMLTEVDLVLITHNHYDHLNKFSIKALAKKTKWFVVPLGVGARLVSWGIARDKIIELDWWEEYRMGPNLMIAATPAQHFSGRGIFDRNKTLWASFVVKAVHHNLFISGDSGYFDGFKKIGDKYGPFDMTFIECGAYNEMWPQVHMFPEETVKAHLDLKGDVLHPIHWGTFNLALHAWFDPMKRLTVAARVKNVPVSTPVVGDTTVYAHYLRQKHWWVEMAVDGGGENISLGKLAPAKQKVIKRRL